MLKVILLMGILLSCGRAEARTSFMPENDLYKQDNIFLAGAVDEQTFNDVINQVGIIYKPIISKLGGNLVIKGAWNDSTVNAYADRNDGNWNVSMFGGLARRQEITKLGFMMVVCHELAHHYGGYPTYQNDWASAEGNSDYAGVAGCMKTVLSRTTENVQYLQKPAVDKCKRYYSGQSLRVCYNIMAGAKSCADLLGVLNGGARPSFYNTDTSVVKQTSHEHPAALCRLNTMSNAAVCMTPWNLTVIPTKGNYKQYSCTTGSEDFRPKCWFAQ